MDGRIVFGMALVGVVAVAGCSDASDSASNTTEASVASPMTTTAAATSVVTDASLTVQGVLDEWVEVAPGGVVVAFASDDRELIMNTAGDDGNHQPLERDAAFRVGSLTKPFVAVMLLQLVADGTIGLDDLVVAHAPDLTIADGVTVRQLLAHRSGIPDVIDELRSTVEADPAHVWTPADVLQLVADQPRDFAPGELFLYSNTNYIVAGLLLETVTGLPVAENLQSRIVEPLGLTSTYFAPDDTRSPIRGFSPLLPGGDTQTESYRAWETAAGASGALVSTASDLAIFIRALAHTEILPDATYAEMIRGLPDEGQTLGVAPSDPPSTTGIAHAGFIPGFMAYMQYDPSTEDLLVLLLNDDSQDPTPLVRSLLDIVGDA
jgi:D-alanyl-D-alanine carboxypeptidase